MQLKACGRKIRNWQNICQRWRRLSASERMAWDGQPFFEPFWTTLAAFVSRMSSGRFPRQVKLSEGSAAWAESEVEAFMLAEDGVLKPPDGSGGLLKCKTYGSDVLSHCDTSSVGSANEATSPCENSQWPLTFLARPVSGLPGRPKVTLDLSSSVLLSK